MTAVYRALFCDLRTDEVLDALPLTGIQFDDYIGKPGSLSGSIPLPDAALAERVRRIVPGRTAVWIERDRDIWWGGIVWTAVRRSPQRGAPAALEIQAATWDSYLDHRILFDTYVADNMDQFDLVRGLIDEVQQETGGDIEITADYGQVSGVARTRTFSRFDLPVVGAVIRELADMENGFEWRIASYRDPGTNRRVKRLQLGHPRIVTGTTDIVLDFPGPVLGYAFSEDATGRATHWQARGATANEDQSAETTPTMSAVRAVPGAIGAGWARLDGSSDHSTIANSETVDANAAADLDRAWRQHTIPEITVAVDGRVTPALLGARIRLRIRDVWHPDGFDQRFRIVGLSVTAPARGQAETAQLYLESLVSPEED
ncbi:hypothetical protein [Yinghuangia soli]|uniref:Minor tail protein n=1 Tax=Yinghuangia soli TaxID=2908204 RepID=A0AA41U698_9ACTN|nr:hypothetical protein [Yinghuangia soli]MCF2532727.1 hypothetical protein [Yinghuangia soli]